ncbi:MAG: prolipoprotein diacylglyceryl transferase [Clostridia bacterium]|nr:prolipoprotein diacylglyceryl transferase [Clostridia bacterium]
MSLRILELQQFLTKREKNDRDLGLFKSITFWAVVELILFSLLHYSYILIFGMGANYFGMLFIMPVVMTAVYCFMGADPLAQVDIMTPALPASLVFVKLCCFFEGCCYGIQSPYGIYFSVRGLFEAPVQLIESFNAFLIFLFLIVYKKFAKKGTMYPAYVFLYSLTRFFSEFVRHEKNVLWVFKSYHFLCFAGIVLGVVAFILVSVRREKLESVLYRFSYKGKQR